jgi:hypothetical protein
VVIICSLSRLNGIAVEVISLGMKNEETIIVTEFGGNYWSWWAFI